MKAEEKKKEKETTGTTLSTLIAGYCNRQRDTKGCADWSVDSEGANIAQASSRRVGTPAASQDKKK